MLVVRLGDSPLRSGPCWGRPSRRRFPRCLPGLEISAEGLRKDATHFGYTFAGGRAAPRPLTVAVAVVADADGAAQEAGRPAQVAGAGVGDVVVAADGLLGQHGDGAGGRAAHDAVGAVGLVGHAGVGAGTHHVGAGLCGERRRKGSVFWGASGGTWRGALTLAVSLVHDLQVPVSHAAGHQQGALVRVGFPVAAAHGVLPGNVRAVGGAHALGPSRLHFADLPRAAFDSLARVWKGRASWISTSADIR